MRAFTIGCPLGCRESACVELMTTLHGSAPSLRRRVGGCVPLEGTIAPARDPFKRLPMSRPQPPPKRKRGTRLNWDSLPSLSDVGVSKSYNCINISHTKIQNKTTIVVVFTLSHYHMHTVLSPIYIYKENYIFTFIDQSAEPTVMNPYSCAGPPECERSLSPSSVPTRTRAKLYA